MKVSRPYKSKSLTILMIYTPQCSMTKRPCFLNADTLVYSLGRGDRYYNGWFSPAATDGDRAKWRLEILAAVAKNRPPGRQDFGVCATEGNAVSHVATAAVAASVHAALYARLSIVSGHAPKYTQDMATWLQGVLLGLEAVGLASTQRAAALRKLGISR